MTHPFTASKETDTVLRLATKRRWWFRLLSPILVYHNPRERLIEPSLPWGKWNLYVGGAGSKPEGWLNVDILAAPGVHIQCDATRLPFRDDCFTRIECDAVLEHVPDVTGVLTEFRRCLEPGGVVHIVVPFCHPQHLYPMDYHRFSPDEIRRLCSEFELLDAGWLTGPTATVLVFLVEYAKLWVRPVWAKRMIHFAAGWLLSPLRYLDYFLLKDERADRMGNHFFIYARKPLVGGGLGMDLAVQRNTTCRSISDADSGGDPIPGGIGGATGV